MEKEKIISYIEGEMELGEKKSFENEMENNPQLAEEVAFMRQLSLDVKSQLVREQVSRALSNGSMSPSDKKNNWFIWLVSFGLLVVVAYFIFRPNNEPIDTIGNNPPPNESPKNKTTPQSEKENNQDLNEIPEIEEKKEETEINEPKKTTPIAENKATLPPPLYPSPNTNNIRGADTVNEELKTILDQIWYMNFPPQKATFSAPYDKATTLLNERDFSKAYVQLQLLERKNPENDTLIFLKGYCLLEMGQGEEAKNQLEKAGTKNISWEKHTEWFLALSNLMAGKNEEAISIFKSIAKDSEHPFNLHAKKAIEIVK